MRQSASTPPRFHSGALVPPPSAPFPSHSTTFMTSLHFYLKFNIYSNLTDTAVTQLTPPRSRQPLGLLVDARFYPRGWLFPVRSDEVFSRFKNCGKFNFLFCSVKSFLSVIGIPHQIFVTPWVFFASPVDSFGQQLQRKNNDIIICLISRSRICVFKQ